MEYAIKHNNQYESIAFKDNVIQTQGESNITLQAKIDDDIFTDYKTISKANTVTTIDLPDKVDLKLISDKPFNYTIHGMTPKYYNKQKIEDYLYEITYGNIDYEYAYKYFKPNYGGCSAIRCGHWFGRNFDWLYNNEVQFVVHTPSSLAHKAVLGVSGIIPDIEQSNVDQESIVIENVDMFKLVPFYLLDGINECGLFCTHNVVPLDNIEFPTQEILAKIEEKDKVCIPMLVRFILDKFTTAEEAIDYLINYTTLYFTDEMLSSGYQSHFLLGDANSTYILEFINNDIKVINFSYITNFPIYNVQFDTQQLIQYPPTQFGMNKYGSGLERWNIISKNYESANSLEGMENLLNLIKYSNTYSSDNFWYSEIVKMTDDEGNKITVDTIPDKCRNAKQNMIYLFRIKDRNDPKVWITCHSCVYNTKDKSLYIHNQEGETKYKFKL